MIAPARSTPIRVAVFTGTRAEYGLLVPILRALTVDERFDPKLIVGGAHLSLLHGMTIKTIVDDGFTIDARIEMLLASDSPSAVTKSMGIALIDLASRLEELRPDILILLGDRYEVLSVAVACVVAGIPIAHIHGGEVTEGAIDDSIRHAVTKLAHVHFVATEDFARRVRQMGEEPERVHVVGAPAMDVISGLGPLTVDELVSDLGLALENDVVIVTYHPSTISGEDPGDAVAEMLSALKRLENTTLLCSLPNADPQYSEVKEAIERFVDLNDNAILLPSIGHRRYLSLVRHASLVVGNSSAGLIEAPVLGTPTVNVGQRQRGRPMAPSVIQANPDADDVYRACTTALTTEFQEIASRRVSPYDRGVSVASEIVRVIAESDLGRLTRKVFVDLETLG